MPAPSLILAIETSQRAGSVALRAGNRTIHNERLISARRHDDDLMPAIDRLFARLDLAPAALGTVAVSIGPGGFTGLRIAVSTAKMFAEALGAKVIAVPSALVAAECFVPEVGDQGSAIGGDRAPEIMVALASKRETFWGTRLRREAGVWRIIDKPGIVDVESTALDGVGALLGDEHLPLRVRERCIEAGTVVVRPVFEATACVRVAERMAAAGVFTDPLALLPLYPRPPEAVSIWEARKKKLPQSR